MEQLHSPTGGGMSGLALECNPSSPPPQLLQPAWTMPPGWPCSSCPRAPVPPSISCVLGSTRGSAGGELVDRPMAPLVTWEELAFGACASAEGNPKLVAITSRQASLRADTAPRARLGFAVMP